jgi:hypothetical protein
MNLRRVETIIVELNRMLVAAVLASVFVIVFVNVSAATDSPIRSPGSRKPHGI